jgi:membrane-bound lytic murein transglycosylase D
MRANNLRNSHLIRAGKRLKIPTRGTTASTVVSLQKHSIPASGIHTVRKGDSLWIIANRYGTTVKKIQSLNNLASTHLYIGQALKIPGFKPIPLAKAGQLKTYWVKNGDSPYTIAQKHNMPLERLLQINQLTTRSKIFPGQKLFIE